jgi:hypothetical protein
VLKISPVLAAKAPLGAAAKRRTRRPHTSLVEWGREFIEMSPTT